MLEKGSSLHVGIGLVSLMLPLQRLLRTAFFTRSTFLEHARGRMLTILRVRTNLANLAGCEIRWSPARV